jgi:ubiquinone biosynthesis UbiH/UbiF/VisC/COQ6 family hydroxylase
VAKTANYDVIIIGAGPAGLGLARALADTGLKLCLIEKQSAKILAHPPLDGRDIALTHDSMRLMKKMEMLRHIPKREISPIRMAKVFSGASPYFLGFDTKGTSKENLGFLVPNNVIRKAAYEAIKKFHNITIKDKSEVKKVVTNAARGTVHLSNGEILTAPLIVAADSRFSRAREQMGITASVKDFERSAIVCRMVHDQPHHEAAHECFFDPWTLAILPLQGRKSSIVITLPSDETDKVMALSPAAFNKRIESYLGDRLGKMRLTGKRYAYPLVGVYANKFTAERFALMGDAAIGMHPVTAHGYNLGLSGAHILAQEIRKALSLGLDIGNTATLEAYARAHRRASAFLYHGTNAMVNVYTDNRPVTLLLRALGLHLANRLPPFKRYVRRQLTGKTI